MKNPNEKIVTIIGGSGFIGRYITRQFAKAGYRVRVAVRRPDLAGFLQPSGGVGQVFPIQCNIRYKDSVENAVKGSDIVINLAGILDERSKQTFAKVNVEGAEYVAQMAAKHNIATLIHFSTLNAAPKSDKEAPYDFFNSNYDGEQKVKAAFANAIIVRPSLVFGPEDRLFNVIAKFAKIKRFIAPIFSDLTKQSQPIHVFDIAKAVFIMAEGGHQGKTFDLGGTVKMTMLEIAQNTLHAINRDIKIIHVPAFIAKPFGSVCTMLPYSWITRGEMVLHNVDNLVSDEAINAGNTLVGLGIEGRNCNEAIMQYLQHFRPEGDYGVHVLKPEVKE